MLISVFLMTKIHLIKYLMTKYSLKHNIKYMHFYLEHAFIITSEYEKLCKIKLFNFISLVVINILSFTTCNRCGK